MGGGKEGREERDGTGGKKGLNPPLSKEKKKEQVPAGSGFVG